MKDQATLGWPSTAQEMIGGIDQATLDLDKRTGRRILKKWRLEWKGLRKKWQEISGCDKQTNRRIINVDHRACVHEYDTLGSRGTTSSAWCMGYPLQLAACAVVRACSLLRLSPQVGVVSSARRSAVHFPRFGCCPCARVVALLLGVA